jgi:hypothetical protein
MGWFVHWMVTKDLVYARYLRIVDRSGSKVLAVKYMALLGESKKKYKIKKGRMTNPDAELQAITDRGELPDPDNNTGEAYHPTHLGDWRRAITDDDVHAQSSGGGCTLEFDYGKDVVAERIVVKTGYTDDVPLSALWVELWNDELLQVYEYQLSKDQKYDLKVKAIAATE